MKVTSDGNQYSRTPRGLILRIARVLDRREKRVPFHKGSAASTTPTNTKARSPRIKAGEIGLSARKCNGVGLSHQSFLCAQRRMRVNAEVVVLYGCFSTLDELHAADVTIDE